MTRPKSARTGKPVSRRGQLSAKDKNYIERFRGKKSAAEIAAHLRRAEHQVKRYLAQTAPPEEPERPPVHSLRLRPEWRHFESQFDEEDLVYLEYRYDALMTQFGWDDVLPTEESQIFDLLTVEIQSAQASTERKPLTTRLKYIQRCLETSYEEILDKSPGTAEYKQVTAVISDMEDNSGTLRKQLKDVDARQAAFSMQRRNLLEALKGTRDQRKKMIEDSRQSFVGVLKALTNEDFRRAEGEELGLMKVAIAKETKRLSQPHTYVDGTKDQPLLTPGNLLEDYDGPN